MIDLILGLSLTIIAMILFAFVNILVARSIRHDKLIEGIYVTIIFSTIIILVSAIVTGQIFQIFSLPPKVWFLYMLTGIFNFLLARSFNYTGISFLGPSRNSAIVATRILFATIFSILLLNESFNVFVLIGVFLAFIGVVMVSLSQDTKAKSFSYVGLIFALSTAFFVGISVVLIREADLISNLSVDGVLIAYLTASILYTPGAIYKQIKSKTLYTRNAFYILAISGVLSGIAQTSRYSALEFAPVVVVASIVAATPLGTMIFSFFLNKKHEILNKELAIGAVVTVIGVIIISVAVNLL